jgi:hypothetical protein
LNAAACGAMAISVVIAYLVCQATCFLGICGILGTPDACGNNYFMLRYSFSYYEKTYTL